MGFSSRKLVSYKLIYLLVPWLCGSNGGFMTYFKIYRDERDIFTNPGTYILGQSSSANSCLRYNAECVNGTDECDYCCCLKGKNTLMIHDNGTIKGCVSDEEIVPESELKYHKTTTLALRLSTIPQESMKIHMECTKRQKTTKMPYLIRITSTISLGTRVCLCQRNRFSNIQWRYQVKREEQINNGVVYETVEEPDQPNNDSFYNYPENTIISQLSSAIDTSAKRDSIPATGTEQRDKHSAPQNGSALYHTLEDPMPPQPPVYSTLEGPDDI